MALVEEDSAPPFSIGLAPSPEPAGVGPSPGFFETLGNAALLENDMVNLYLLLNRKYHAPNPLYDAAEGARNSPLFTAHGRLLAQAESEQERISLERQIVEDERTRRDLAAAGLGGIVAGMFMGMVSPTVFIPLTTPVRGARGAQIVVRNAALAAGLQEGALALNQPTRPGVETLMGFGTATVLGSFLGGAAQYFRGSAEDVVVRMYGGDDPLAIQYTPGTLSAAQVIKDPGVIARVGAAGRVIGQLGPATRQLVQRDLDTVRLAMAELEDAGLKLEGNREFIPTAEGGNVNNRLMAYNAPLARTISDLDDAWNTHRLGKTPAILGGLRAQVFGSGQGKLSRSDFNREVALRLTELEDHTIPEVNFAAKSIRENVFDPMFAEAKRVGLISEDAKVVGDEAYLHRLYNEKEIASRPSEFIDLIAKHIEAKMEERFRLRLAKLEKRVARRQQRAKDLTLGETEADQLRKQFTEEIADLKEHHPGMAVQEQIDYLNWIGRGTDDAVVKADIRKQVSQLRKDNEGNVEFTDFTSRMQNARSRLSNLGAGRVNIARRQKDLLQRADRLEETNLEALDKLIKKGQSILAKLDRLSDTELDRELHKLIKRVVRSREIIDKGETRLLRLRAELGEAFVDGGDLADTLRKGVDELFDLQQRRKVRLENVEERLNDALDLDREGVRAAVKLTVDDAMNSTSILNNSRAVRAEKLRSKALQLDPGQAAVESGKIQSNVDQLYSDLKLSQVGVQNLDLDKGVGDFSVPARDLAQAFKDKIMGLPIRTPGWDFLQSKRASALLRTLDLPTRALGAFVETNVEKIIRSYVRTLGPDIEIYRKFGTVDGSNIIGTGGKIDQELNFRLEGLDPKIKDAAFEVRKRVINGLHAAGRPLKEAQAAGVMWEAFFTSIASRTGKSVGELWDTYSPEIKRGLPGERSDFEQEAFHVSPHTFDHFRLDDGVIGGGEGNQAFGWGIYAMEAKEVRRHYEQFFKSITRAIFTLSEATTAVRTGLPSNLEELVTQSIPGVDGKRIDQAIDIIGHFIGTHNAGISGTLTRANLIKRMKNPTGRPSTASDGVKLQWTIEDEVIKHLDDSVWGKPVRTYTVDVPENELLLKWEVPLNKQSQYIQDRMIQIAREHLGVTDPDALRHLTGRDFYSVLTRRMKTSAGRQDKQASIALRDVGIMGHRYLDGFSRGKGKGTHNFVIYDASKIAIKRMAQQGPTGPRGGIEFGPKTVIKLFDNADSSTFMHESAHFFLRMMENLAPSTRTLAKDLDSISEFLGSKKGVIPRDGHEKFARAFEQFLREGKAPTPELKTVFQQFADWLRNLYKQATELKVKITPEVEDFFSRILTPETAGRKPTEATQLQDAANAGKRDLEVVINRLRHLRGMPSNPDDFFYRLGRTALDANVARLMGNVVPASLADVGRPVQKFGLMNTLKHGYLPMITNWKRLKMTKREARLVGATVDPILHSRFNAMMDIVDDMGRRNMLERGVQMASQKTGVIALFDYWNAFHKQLTVGIVNAKLWESIETVLDPKAGPRLLRDAQEFLASSGVGRDGVDMLMEQLNTPGAFDRVNGVIMPNTQAWDNPEAVRTFRAIMAKGMNDTIVTPGAERPSWVDSSVGAKMIAQFRSFTFSSTFKVLLAGMQDRNAAFFLGSAMSFAMAAMSFYISAITTGGKAKERMLNATYEEWVEEMIDRGGQFGVFNEARMMADKLPGTPTVFSEGFASRSGQGAVGQVLGPSFGLLEEGFKLLSGIDDPTQSTVHTARKLLPYQNVFWARGAYTEAEDIFNSTFNVPERRAPRRP